MKLVVVLPQMAQMAQMEGREDGWVTGGGFLWRFSE
jgi:hypothetical protein